jgi:predicted nuclease with TOPRIM domain
VFEQHRLLDDMRNVLQVTKQMVEEKAYEIDGLQDQLQAKVAREQELQARIDQLQAEATGLKATVSTLAEQGAVLKRLLALHNDSTSSRSAPNSPLSRPN